MTTQRSRRLLLSGTILLLFVALALALFASARRSSPEAGALLSVDDARARARAFANMPDLALELGRDTSVAGAPTYELVAAGGVPSFVIDRRNGEVVLAYLGGAGETGTATVPTALSRQVAEDFLVAHGLQPDGMELQTTYPGMLNDASPLVRFEWREVREGVKLPRWVSVTVGRYTGRVVAFSRKYEPLPPSLKASIDRDKAIALASSVVSWQARETTATLEVWPMKGVPVLRWTVVLRGSTPVSSTGVSGLEVAVRRSATVYVDAVTGAILEQHEM